MVATSRTTEELEQRAFRTAEIAQAMRELKATDGWKVLAETFERQRAGYFDTLARDLMRGKEIDQRKLDYNRGFFESVEQLLKAPENAERLLERAVKSLKRRREQDEQERSDAE